jgi:hypothetical protein
MISAARRTGERLYRYSIGGMSCFQAQQSLIIARLSQVHHRTANK